MSEVSIAILDAAETRIRTGGFNGFSFREIADDVGVKSSSVHYHFATKEKLAAAVVRRYTDRVAEMIDEELAKGANPYEILSRAFKATVHSAGRMCPGAILGAASLDLPAEVGVEVQQFFKMWLDKMMAGGLSPSEATELLATFTGAMVVATALNDNTAFDLATSEFLKAHVSH